MRKKKHKPLDGDEYPDSITWFYRPRHGEFSESTPDEDVFERHFEKDHEDLEHHDWEDAREPDFQDTSPEDFP